MIAILCDSYDRAKELFEMFMNILRFEGLGTIARTWPHCLCVETDSDLRYIFTDYHYEGVFENLKADIMDEDDFLFGLDELYCIPNGRL